VRVISSGCGNIFRERIRFRDAGMRNFATGLLNEMLFCCNYLYMILGPTRFQMLYPNMDREVEDSQSEKVLIQVNFTQLRANAREDSNTEQNWAELHL
jgi:ABC-type uncharacterized transport system fused permease/ATPase subunit